MELADLVAQARGRQPWRPVLDDASRARLARSARALSDAAADGQVYGLTTGVGALRDVPVGAEGGQGLRLWRSHAAGFGPELDDDEARLTMAVRLHQLAAGPSGVSVGLADALERALVGGAVPVLHGYGGIGTADLTVLAELGLALVGEGEWRHGAPAPATARESDALPFISSGARTAATGALVHADLGALLGATEEVAARSFRALRGNAQAYDARVFAGRDDPAAAAAAARMRELVGVGGEPARVQDPFALRTVPQVHGVATAALDAAAAAVRAEIGASGENPLPVDGAALHHGQFLTQRLAAAFDAVREAWVAVATLSQARLSALMDPRLTGRPAFLAHGPAGSSGAMVLEYVAADVLARLRTTAAPATLGRTSVSIGLEETASHATQSVLEARRAAALLPDLLACELVAADLALGEPVEDHVLGDRLRAAAAQVSGRAAMQPIRG